MRKISIIGVVAVFAVLLFIRNGGQLWKDEVGSTASSHGAIDDVFSAAFEARRGNFVAEGSGTVKRILSDDNDGSRHQRFILELSSGQTLLIAHNIDLASRIESLGVGDEVSFKGEYEWSEKGGTVHWTHHDPAGRHEAGWIRHKAAVYQ